MDYEYYQIKGNSMLPELKDGDKVLVNPQEDYQVGDVVVAQHPFKQSVFLIKRISEIDEKSIFLLGDNLSESTDSRTLGKIQKKDVLGKVIKKIG